MQYVNTEGLLFCLEPNAHGSIWIIAQCLYTRYANTPPRTVPKYMRTGRYSYELKPQLCHVLVNVLRSQVLRHHVGWIVFPGYFLD